MADPTPPPDDIRALVDEIRRLEGRVRDLERPTGTQRNRVVEEVQAAVAELQAQQATLVAQQATLLAQQNFLLTQVAGDSRSTQTSYTGSASGTTWQGFNSTYNCELTVSTGAAGKLIIIANATFGGIGSGGFGGLLGIEIVGVVSPTFPGPYSSLVSNASAGGVRAVVAGLAANTSYTVRTRHGYDGVGSGTALWRDQTLVILRS